MHVHMQRRTDVPDATAASNSCGVLTFCTFTMLSCTIGN